jgi:hypothetical protein
MSLILPQPEIQQVTLERHKSKRWRGPPSYAFASSTAVLPIFGSEAAAAAMSLPLAFVQSEEAFVLAAVLGLEPGANLFVSPDGRWLCNYLPVALRAYPFMLLPMTDGVYTLCVDESGGMVTEGGEGKPFFEEDGQELSSVLKKVMEVLSRAENARASSLPACAAIHQHGLLRPWAVTAQTEQGTRSIDGLFFVDEEALGALPDNEFLEVRRTGGLALAYTQLLSMQNMASLVHQAQIKAAATANALRLTESGTLDTSFLSGDTIRF